MFEILRKRLDSCSFDKLRTSKFGTPEVQDKENPAIVMAGLTCVAVPATAKRMNISALQIGGQFNLLFTIDNGSTLLTTGLQLGN
jgi:hypothetical protein